MKIRIISLLICVLCIPIVCFAAQSIVEQTYWRTVAHRVKSFWVLPEMSKWDSNLLAQVVIIINKNGEVAKIQFYQRSKDPLFDQFVEKTIKIAAPMPPFPSIMKQETTEIGFIFRPGDLDNLKFDNNADEIDKIDVEYNIKKGVIAIDDRDNQLRKQEEFQKTQVTEEEAKKQQGIQRKKLEEEQLKMQNEKEKKDQLFNM